jgi:hypothetical protein
VNVYFQEIYEYTSEDLVDLGEIGRGNFGSVNKMLHRQSQTKMAVKVLMLVSTISLTSE